MKQGLLLLLVLFNSLAKAQLKQTGGQFFSVGPKYGITINASTLKGFELGYNRQNFPPNYHFVDFKYYFSYLQNTQTLHKVNDLKWTAGIGHIVSIKGNVYNNFAWSLGLGLTGGINRSVKSINMDQNSFQTLNYKTRLYIGFRIRPCLLVGITKNVRMELYTYADIRKYIHAGIGANLLIGKLEKK